jgi:hypothetical protein
MQHKITRFSASVCVAVLHVACSTYTYVQLIVRALAAKAASSLSGPNPLCPSLAAGSPIRNKSVTSAKCDEPLLFSLARCSPLIAGESVGIYRAAAVPGAWATIDHIAAPGARLLDPAAVRAACNYRPNRLFLAFF